MTKSFNYMEDALGEGAVMTLAEHGATIINALQLQAKRFEEYAKEAERGSETGVLTRNRYVDPEEEQEFLSIEPAPARFAAMAKAFAEQAEKCWAAAKRVEDWREAANGTVELKEE